LLEEARELGPFSILEVLGRDGGDDAGSGMPRKGSLFSEGILAYLAPERRLLVGG
jgi:hypothetical protein